MIQLLVFTSIFQFKGGIRLNIHTITKTRSSNSNIDQIADFLSVQLVDKSKSKQSINQARSTQVRSTLSNQMKSSTSAKASSKNLDEQKQQPRVQIKKTVESSRITAQPKDGVGLSMQKSLFGSQLIGSKIAKLQDTGNFYAHKIERDTNRLENIEQEIQKTEKFLLEKRKETVIRKRENNDNDPFVLDKKIRSMHLKLDYLKKKYNESLASNDTLKEEINHLRREKNIFDVIYVNLKTELEEKKEQLKKVLQESKLAKEEIEKGQERLGKVKSEAEHEKKKFLNELESDPFQLKSTAKTTDRLHGSQQSTGFMPAMKQETFFKTGIESNNYLNGTNASMSNGFRKKDRVKKNTGQKDNIQLEILKQELFEYEDIFKQLMAETGTQDMSSIVKKFMECENENYSLFKYISALRGETENLENQKKELQAQIDYYKNRSQEVKTEPKTIKFMELKKQIQDIHNKKEKYAEKQVATQQQIEILKKNIPLMFEQLGCQETVYIKDLPKNHDGTLAEIDESNMVLYLAVIERRTNDMLSIYGEINKSKGVEPKKFGTGEETTMSNSHIAQKVIKFDDLDLVLEPLRDEFKQNNEKAKEDKRNKEFTMGISEVSKEKNLMDIAEFRENARNELKKIQVKTKVVKKNIK